jgi:flagellar basal body-associated protein FliL
MSRVTTGSWGLEENKIYLDFLRTYKRDFENEVARRKSTVFNRLSKALRKRTPDQCRSHHQKLQNRFKNNLDEIMEFVRSKIEKLTAET